MPALHSSRTDPEFDAFGQCALYHNQTRAERLRFLIRKDIEAEQENIRKLIEKAREMYG